MGKNNKQKKKNNPFYMNENMINGIQTEENHSITIKKFQLGIDKNGNPIITIDNIMHNFTKNQFHAITLGIINVNKKINPEIDYEKILMQKS